MNVVSTRKNERKKYYKRKKDDEKALVKTLKLHQRALAIACVRLQGEYKSWQEIQDEILLKAKEAE